MRWFVLIALAGCSGGDGAPEITSEEFVSEYPTGYCGLWAECNPDELERMYGGDVSICIEDLEDTQRDRLDRVGCAFDGVAAAECVDILATLECIEWEQGDGNVCGDVIDCS